MFLFKYKYKIILKCLRFNLVLYYWVYIEILVNLFRVIIMLNIVKFLFKMFYSVFGLLGGKKIINF